MILTILSLILFITFLVLGGFHFYWLFGGLWGLDKVIPSDAHQKVTLAIPKFATLVVALTLVLFGLMYLIKAGLYSIAFPHWLITYGYWFIPIVFILRAVGEFKYVGLFKKIKDTAFAKADSKVFTPLCLTIGIIGLLIQFLG